VTARFEGGVDLVANECGVAFIEAEAVEQRCVDGGLRGKEGEDAVDIVAAETTENIAAVRRGRVRGAHKAARDRTAATGHSGCVDSEGVFNWSLQRPTF
jgi:hypothetical protein